MTVKNLNKNTYESPVTEVIEIKQEGSFCNSGEIPEMEHGWDIVFEPDSNPGLELNF